MNGRYEGEISISPQKFICKPNGCGKVTVYQEDEIVSWTYEGAFVDGRITGQGKTTYGNPCPDWPALAGQVYIGTHDDSNAHGEGTWYYPDGAKRYFGDNQKGEWHGQGTSYRHDGTIREDGTREDGTREYEGTWQESYWKDNGTLYRPDGTISREGEWVYGGSLEYEWQDEMCWYEGDWDEEDYAHGWGIMYRPDRVTVAREGWWQNGEPVDGPPSDYPEAA